MQVSISKSDIIWSYLGTFMTLCSNVIMVPLMAYFLAGESLGLWFVFISIGAITNLFDFGFTITFARNITYCWSGVSSLKKMGTDYSQSGDPDYFLMKKVLSTCKIIYFVISLIALLGLLTVGTYYIETISENFKGHTHIVAWVVYSIATFLNLYYNYYDSFLRGVGAIKRANKNRVIARFVNIILLIGLLLGGFGILGASIAYSSYGIIFRFLGKKYFYEYKDIGEHLSRIKDRFSYPQIKELFITIWYNAWRDGLIQLCSYCCGQLSVIICSLYLSLTETGAYSVGQQMAGAVAALSSVLYATYQPALQEAYANRNITKMKQCMSTIVCVYSLSFLIGTLLVVVIGVPIMRLIRPESVVSIPVLLGISLCLFITNYRTIYTSYFSSTNRIIYMKSFIFASFVCVLLSFVLMGTFKLGLWGLIIAQFFSQAMFNAWYWPLKANQEMNLHFSEMTALFINSLKAKLVK